MICYRCGGDLSELSFPFGEDVQCTHCGVVNTTDMEESYDSLYWWTTGTVTKDNEMGED